MKKKVCPPGQICVGSNLLITILIFVIVLLLFFILGNVIPKETISSLDNFSSYNRPLNNNKSIQNNKSINNNKSIKECSKSFINDEDFDNGVKDTNIVIKFQPETTSSYLVNKDYERIINPLLPPERRNHYIDPNSHKMVSPGVPINIPTRGESGGIQQVGVLHKIDSTDSTMKIGQNTEPVILPLMGALTYTGSNKWTYYTSTDKYNQIKLPITNNNRQCDSEYGCDELYDEDIVTIPAYNGSFKVNKYQFDKPRYLPFI
uniref:Uncharacterized protein n=1 Tax=viral metagenome TaxID=1070528 RepID=A0A6C0JB23_9ZZZZ